MTDLTLQEQRTAALAADRAEWDAHLATSERRRVEDDEWLSELHQWAIPIGPETYDAWLTGHLKRGGKVTHFYDYDMSRWRWYSATHSFEIRPLYGSSAINLVVPEGVTVTGSTGHNSLYFMDGFTSRGFHDLPAIVPCFTDTKIVKEKR